MSGATGATTIVVGGGILGATTAYQLAAAGTDVLLLEARRFGEQSTGKSAAIVRGHYSNPEVVRMAVRSRETFRRLPLLLECDPVYTQSGWLFLVDEENASFAVENAEMQDGEGLDTVEVEDLAEYLPGIDESGIAYALYEPDAGCAEPVAATNAYIAALRAAGGRASAGTPVERIEVEGDRVRGVHAAGELLGCDNVVLAAGPWTLRLAAGVGLDLPLEITREQDVIFETAPEPTIPTAVRRRSTGSTFGPRPRSALRTCSSAGGSSKEYEKVDADDFDEVVDAAFEQDVLDRVTASRVSPGCGGSAAASACTTSPRTGTDPRPVDGLDGLFLATGGSGTASSSARDRRARRRRRARAADGYAGRARLLARALRRGARVPLDLRRQPA